MPKARTPRPSNILERENEWEINALRDYLKEYTDRSCNIDDTNRTLSVLDENEAQDVMFFNPVNKM